MTFPLSPVIQMPVSSPNCADQSVHADQAIRTDCHLKSLPNLVAERKVNDLTQVYTDAGRRTTNAKSVSRRSLCALPLIEESPGERLLIPEAQDFFLYLPWIGTIKGTVGQSSLVGRWLQAVVCNMVGASFVAFVLRIAGYK